MPVLARWFRPFGFLLGLLGIFLSIHVRAATLTRYTVESFAMVEEEVAQDLARSVKALGYSPRVVKLTGEGATTFVVSAGTFNSQAQALQAQGLLNRQRFMFVITSVEVEVPPLRLLSVTMEDEDLASGAGPGDRVVFTFNMPVRLSQGVPQRGSLEELLAAMGQFTAFPISATSAALYERGERVVLVLGGVVRQNDTPAGAFLPLPTFAVGKDGQGVDNTTPVPLGGSFDNLRPPQLLSVVLTDADGQTGPGPGDSLRFVFNKPVTVKKDDGPTPETGSLAELLGLLGAFSQPGNLSAPKATLRQMGRELVVVLDSPATGNQPPGGLFTPRATVLDLTDGTRPVQEKPAPVTGTFNDAMAPRLLRLSQRDTAGQPGPQPKDTLTLHYSEPLDSTFVSRKKLRGPLRALLGQFITLPPGQPLEATESSLSPQGLNLVFTLGGKVSGGALKGRVSPLPGSVLDASGNKLKDTSPAPVEGHFNDQVAPRLLSVSLRDTGHNPGPGPGDEIGFVFSEPVKAPGVAKQGPCLTLLGAVANFASGNLTGGDCTLLWTGPTVTLRLGKGAVTQGGAMPQGPVKAGWGLKDASGNVPTADDTVKITGTFNDTTPPRLEEVTLKDTDQQAGFGKGDEIRFRFSESVKNETNRDKLTGAATLSQALAVLGRFAQQSQTESAPISARVSGRVVVLTHAGGPTIPAMTGPFTPLAGEITDVSGNTLAARNPVKVLGSVNDQTPPRLLRVELRNHDSQKGLGVSDALALVFNEAISLSPLPPRLPVMNLLRGLGVLEGGAEIRVSQSDLTVSGSEILITFLTPGTLYHPKAAFDASKPPRRFTPALGIVRDKAGNPLYARDTVPVMGHFGDTTAPQLLKVVLKGVDGQRGVGAGDRLVFVFSEPVKAPGLTPGGLGPCGAVQRAVALFEQGNLTGGDCQWSVQGAQIVITLAQGAVSENAQAPAGKISAAPSLTDMAGNHASAAKAVLEGSLDDVTAPRLVSVRLKDNDAAQGFGTGDFIQFVFSEAVDNDANREKLKEEMTLKNALEVLGQFETETGTDRFTVSVGWLSKSLTLKQIGGEPAMAFGGGFLPKAGAFTDEAGNLLKDVSPVTPEGTVNDSVAPRLLRVLMKDGDGAAGIGPGDHLTFVFSEPVKLAAVPPKGTSAESVLRALGQFAEGAVLSAPSSELTLSSSQVQLTLLAAGRFTAPKASFSAMEPPRRFTPLPGLVRDAVGNTLVLTASVLVEGNLADSSAPMLEMVYLRDGDRQKGIGPGDRMVLRFNEPVRLLVPETRLNWPQFTRYIGKFDAGGPMEGAVTLAMRGNDLVVTFADMPAMAEPPKGQFTPVRTSFADAARNLLATEGGAPVEGSFDDQSAPRLKSVTLLDGNQRPDLGQGDALLLEYSEPLTGAKSKAIARTAPLGEILALLGEFPGLSPAALAARAQALVQRNEVYVLLKEDTKEIVDTPQHFIPKTGSVDDDAGNTLTDPVPAPVRGSFKDAVPPKLKRVVLQDKDGQFGPGKGDLVFFDFTEEVTWLADVPAEGTVKEVLAKVGYFSSPGGFEQARVKAEKNALGLKLEVTESAPGSAAPRGKFTLRGEVVKDTGGNLNAEGADALVQGDYARDVPPVLVALRYMDLDQNGLITKNDRILFEYSKPMDATNLVKVGELTRLLAQLGETRLTRGFNAGECWLSVQGKVISILVGGRLYGESSLFSTFESKSELLRDTDRNALVATRPQDVLVQSTQRSAPVKAMDTTPRVVALVATFETQAMAAQVQDQLLAKEIPSLIRSRMEKGRTLYLVIAPLPEDLLKRNDILDKIGAMGHQPTLVLVSNRYVTP